jgi:hypothetical protein
MMPAIVTEGQPRGPFAIGRPDRNTLRLRVDLREDSTGFEPGMMVRLVSEGR